MPALRWFVGGSVLAITLLGAAPPAAIAREGFGGFRCGSVIVRDGETEDDVAVKCGDPDAVRSWTEMRTESIWEWGRKIERSVPIQYDEWKYDLGRGRLIRYVTFVQGRLASTRTGGYGYGR